MSENIVQAKSAEIPPVSSLLHTPKKAYGEERKFKLAVAVGAAIALMVIILLGLWLSDKAVQTDFSEKNLAPCFEHPFGTDWMGRDMLARTLAGLSTSLLVGLVAASASALVALCLGLIAALGGRRVDSVILWLIDLVMSVPHLILLILISFAVGKGFLGVVLGISLTHWPSLARVVRVEVLRCKTSTYIAVANKLGQSPMSIAGKHILPYVLPQFLVGLVLLLPHAILHEAAITFLGFGLPPEQPAIGVILSESMGYLSAGAWWLAVFPGLALVCAVILFDLAGNSVRGLIDYRSSQV